MSTGDPKKLSALLKKLRAAHVPKAKDGDFDPLAVLTPAEVFEPRQHEVACSGMAIQQLVYSLLLWEASSTQAKGAMKRVREQLVDLNELRVCAIDDLAHVLGDRYPLARERAMRIRCILADIVTHFHIPTIDPVLTMPKRDARQFLESLDGMPSFAAQRVALLAMQTHAIPVDERLLTLLVDAKVLQAGTDCHHASSWLEHNVPADDGAVTAMMLQAWSDAEGQTPKRPEPSELVTELSTVRHVRTKRPAKAGAKAESGKSKKKSPKSGN
ncbi:MAG TPA: hypothetical protein VK157_05825 [Phycisphaerales bacterium]|nr:hypothetical protein [Phycisphaerales bacterium]